MIIRFSGFFSFVVISLLLSGCVPPSEPVYEGVLVDHNTEPARRIFNLQNNRQVDSLLFYLNSENPSFRFMAAEAFGSFPSVSEEVKDSLLVHLRDRNLDVREVVAYALGQIGDEDVADKLSLAFDTLGTPVKFNAAVLAAVGKTGDARNLEQITSITTYQDVDTVLSAGQAWCIYYFANRKVTSVEGGEKMLAWLLNKNAPMEMRKPAAYYLQRFKADINEEQEEELRGLLRDETNPDILMGTARTLGRSKTPTARVALLRASRTAPDWRVRTEIIRALADFEYTSVREPIVERLKDEHPLVRRTAADFLLNNGTPADATFYRQLARDSSRTDTRYVLYAAANRHLPLSFSDYRGRINYDLQRAYANTTDPYEKTGILNALAEFPWNYRTIYELYQQSDQALVRSAAAEGLYSISTREDFVAFFRSSSRRVRLDLSTYFREMITSLEAGPSFSSANALKENAVDYQVFLQQPDWFNTALRGFNLPKDIESYRAVDAARAAILGESAPEPHVVDVASRAIDWDIIGLADKGNVVIRTDAGKITLKLWPAKAPATVSSFLSLVRAKYYDGKVFHRVVPNFVAQGGGPIGDGFGSEDFSIRTETPGPRWDRPGLIGMASAGKDTEGVQFFITHRPTPHLDGGYTIFGEVVDGQEVVDRLVMGSKIESVEIR